MPCRIIPFILCLILALAGASAARAAEAIGTIVSVEGAATVTPPGQPPAAAVLNGKIQLNDVVETGPQSRVFILFADDTQMTLSEKTKLTVDAYVYDPDNNAKNKAHYSILEGAFQYVSGLIAKKPDPDVAIDTPVGNIGIRGTDLWAGTVDNVYGVYVNEGRVNLKTDGGQVQVAAGLGATAASRQAAPSEARKWAEDRIRFIQASVALKERALIAQRMEKIRRERDQMEQQKRQEIMAQLKQSLEQKLAAMKAQIVQTAAQKRAQAQQQVKAAVERAVEQKRQELLGYQQQAQALMQRAAQDQGAAKMADIQQLQALKQLAGQAEQRARQEITAVAQQAIQQQTAAVTQEMQQLFAQLQQKLKQEMEQEAQSLKQGARQQLMGQMQQMVEKNKQELQAQLKQVETEARQEAQKVIEQAQQKGK